MNHIILPDERVVKIAKIARQNSNITTSGGGERERCCRTYPHHSRSYAPARFFVQPTLKIHALYDVNLALAIILSI
jgi:hypothetical protein